MASDFARGVYFLDLAPPRADDSGRKDISFMEGGRVNPPSSYRVLGFHLNSHLEYYLGEIACLLGGITRVGLYETLGAQAT